jgi:nucleotide-binding universal stress UspA family protein
VLVALDAGDRSLDALRLGERFARMLDAPVLLFSAFPHALLQDPGDVEAKAIRGEARETLLELGATMDGVRVGDALVVASNSPARELQRLSERGDVGLIVVGSTHRGRVGRVVPGSVGERLLSGAACPVAVAPLAYADGELREAGLIGVGFDGSEEARRALAAARALAQRSGARMRVIAVHEPLSFGAQPAEFGMTTESVNERLAAELRGALGAALAGTDADGVFETGSAADVLAAHSAELDLLVTGSRGYGPLGAVLLGGTTHRLVRAAECPVLVLPRGAEPGVLAAPSRKGGP